MIYKLAKLSSLLTLLDMMESILISLGQYNSPKAVTATNYSDFLQQNFGPTSSLVSKYGPLSAFNITPFPLFFAISTILTDISYECSAYRVEHQIPVWTYLWSHTPSCPWVDHPASMLTLVGATHSAAFIFANTHSLPAPSAICNFSSRE